MNDLPVGIVDYGMGNLHSVAKAFAAQGARVTVSDDAGRLKRSRLLVLPGVGSFGAAARILAKKKLIRFLREWVNSARPYMGICLGFQLLFERSEEDPGVPGLGIFKGNVVRFSKSARRRKRIKIPHMGWNQLNGRSAASRNYFKELAHSDYFYFVHEFYPVPADAALVGSTTEYGDVFCSSVAKGSLFASQFHPEKSGAVGLKLIANVLKAASA